VDDPLRCSGGKLFNPNEDDLGVDDVVDDGMNAITPLLQREMMMHDVSSISRLIAFV